MCAYVCDVINLICNEYKWTANIFHFDCLWSHFKKGLMFPWYFFHLKNENHFLFSWGMISYFIIQDAAALSLDDTVYSILVKIYMRKFSTLSELCSKHQQPNKKIIILSRSHCHILVRDFNAFARCAHREHILSEARVEHELQDTKAHLGISEINFIHASLFPPNPGPTSSIWIYRQANP